MKSLMKWFANTKDNGNIICQSISPTRFVSLFPVQVTSCLWIDRKWFEKWYMNILPRNFKINWCRLGNQKHNGKNLESTICTAQSMIYYSASGTLYRHFCPATLKKPICVKIYWNSLYKVTCKRMICLLHILKSIRS